MRLVMFVCECVHDQKRMFTHLPVKYLHSKGACLLIQFMSPEMFAISIESCREFNTIHHVSIHMIVTVPGDSGLSMVPLKICFK